MRPQLTGTDNFRSLHGLPAHGGRRITGHAVLRSGQLHELNETDWVVLRTLGVKTVCDLRSDHERQHRPSRLPPDDGPQQLSMAIISDVRGDAGFAQMLRERPDAEGGEAMMLAIYRDLPQALAPHLQRLFGLFESGEVPVLIHCAAGKDRTGFAVAVLLHALGASRETIMADYLLSSPGPDAVSNTRREALRELVVNMVGRPCGDAMIEAILDARAEYLQAAFDSVEQQHGSMDAYIEAHAGLDADALQRLRDRWLR
jgi:protein-tyrosine phosphatase